MISAHERFKTIKRYGVEEGWLNDAYHKLLVMTWTRFSIIFCSIFLAFNGVFGFLYWIIPETIGGSNGTYWNAFSFSVQTFSTIGYGMFTPNTGWAHFLVVLESMLSILTTAVLTGLTFAKFSRPSARIAFSKNVLLTSFDGKPALMFRMGNLRGNQIVEAVVHAVALINQTTREGHQLRRQVDLKLLRDNSLFFALSWSVIHVIDAESPLHGLSPEEIIRRNIELAVSVVGYDATFSQNVHSNAIYTSEDFISGKQFQDIIETANGKVLSIHYENIDVLKSD